MPSRTRLDLALVARGLSPTRERARGLILAGEVSVNGAVTTKAGAPVDDTDTVTLRVPDHPWVSRGGLKLDHALRAFGLDATGALALDLGASTGGFTDVLLARGARQVVAVDVGAGQLDWRLRTDARVVLIERTNARYLTPEQLPAGARQFDLVVIDVSFISLAHILPVVPPLLAPGGHVVALVKPQFEAGRGEVGAGGIVTDAATHERVIAHVTGAAHQVGLKRLGLETSPVTGREGNREFLMLLAALASR
jgi:23S rRNA (cytidine1920-2'-O)/16S rRNA (cytidine1409-2'-O)-methyltransferase